MLWLWLILRKRNVGNDMLNLKNKGINNLTFRNQFMKFFFNFNC